MKKLTKAERAAIVNANVLRQEEKDKMAAQVALDVADKNKADALEKAYNLDPELWRKKNLMRQSVAAICSSLERTAFLEARLTGCYDGKVRALSRPGDTELELGLVELVAASYVRLQWIETAYGVVTKNLGFNSSIEAIDFWNRNLEGAQRRFRKACVDLARVRRLALPILLVNIGHKQQVNVGLITKEPKGKG